MDEIKDEIKDETTDETTDEIKDETTLKPMLNLYNYYKSDDYIDDCVEWETVETWFDLCDLMIKYMNGIISIPGWKHQMGRRSFENPTFQNILRRINAAHILTTSSQLAGRSSWDNHLTIRREFIKIHVPVDNLCEILDELLEHNLYLFINVASAAADKLQITIKYATNISTKFKIAYTRSRTGTFITNYMMSHENNDFHNLWRKHSDKQYNSQQIPLTLDLNEDNTWKILNGFNHKDLYLPVRFITTPKEYANIFNNIKSFVLDNIANLTIIDPEWNDSPYNLLNIVKQIAEKISINDIKLNPIEPKMVLC